MGEGPSETAINDAIDAWHESASALFLHEWLGWSFGEYAEWVKNPGNVPDRPLPAKSQTHPVEGGSE